MELVIKHQTLQDWIWAMPNVGPDIGTLIEFGPLQAHLHWTRRDIYVDVMDRTLPGRKCIVIETVEVEHEHRGKGWMKRMLSMLATFADVDYIVIACVVNLDLERSLRNARWSPINIEGIMAKDFAKTPRHILGI